MSSNSVNMCPGGTGRIGCATPRLAALLALAAAFVPVADAQDCVAGTYSLGYNCYPTVDVHIHIATWGEEISWSMDDGEATTYSGGYDPLRPHQVFTHIEQLTTLNRTTHVHPIVLPVGNHTFTYTDSLADGWHGGYWEILDACGETIGGGLPLGLVNGAGGTFAFAGGAQCCECEASAGCVEADLPAAVVCAECLVGRYSDMINVVECDACAAGSHSAPGSSACTDCPAGKSDADQDPATPCASCLPGRFSDAIGATLCANCVDGKSPNSDRTGCVDCAVGFAGVGGLCTQCLPGRFSDAIGATLCADCVDGKSPNSDRTGCVDCADGFAGVGGLCTQCAAGWYPTASRTRCRRGAPDDCDGFWSVCGVNCGQTTYSVTSPAVGSGQPCAAAHGQTRRCTGGEGDCPYAACSIDASDVCKVWEYAPWQCQFGAINFDGTDSCGCVPCLAPNVKSANGRGCGAAYRCTPGSTCDTHSNTASPSVVGWCDVVQSTNQPGRVVMVDDLMAVVAAVESGGRHADNCPLCDVNADNTIDHHDTMMVASAIDGDPACATAHPRPAASLNPWIDVRRVHVDGELLGYTTYRLMVDLPPWARSMNMLTGSEESPMVLPAAWSQSMESPWNHFAKPGLNPEFIASSAYTMLQGMYPLIEYTSYVTVGGCDPRGGLWALESLHAGMQGRSMDEGWPIDAASGSALYTSGFTECDIFESRPADGSVLSVMVAQLTIPTGANTSVSMSIGGKSNGPCDTQERDWVSDGPLQWTLPVQRPPANTDSAVGGEFGCNIQTDCIPCPPATFSADGGACVSCEAVGMVPNAQQTSCEVCAAGKTPSDSQSTGTKF
jgi:hypothetical protein